MIPIVLGVAALAALALSSCGGDGAGLNGNNDNTDAGGTGGTGGTTSSGSSGFGTGGKGGSSGTTGTGGTSGTSGTGTTGGLGGTGGTGGLDGGSGGEAGAVDGGGGSGGGDPEIVPYHFGLLYGSNGINGSGTLTFENSTSCKLLSGSFNAQVQGGSPFNFSVNLGGNQSLDICQSEELPLSGGLFDGVTWYLTNHSENPPFNQSWEITSCLGGDAGTGTCSGALEATIQ